MVPTVPGRGVPQALARVFAAGEQTWRSIAARGAQVLGRRWRWLGPLARAYLTAFPGPVSPRRRKVERFLWTEPVFCEALEKYGAEVVLADPFVAVQAMQPVEAVRGWKLPAIATVGELAAWLEITVAELEWFADLKGLGTGDGAKLGHYHYRPVAKNSGGWRLIESPKQRLKALQRKVLHGILDPVPVHAAVHGFVKERSIRTFAAPHVGQPVVLRLDLGDFFPSVSGRRVQAIFRTLGYPEAVADLLGGICTNAVPRGVWAAVSADPSGLRELRAVYGRPHLPQGAPTSPALANLCGYRLDCRLSGLAEASGARYTRYADDLAFSGSGAFSRGVERFAAHAAAVAMEEGFVVNVRKTRAMRQGVRQHLAGLVVNTRLNVGRKEFDALKALLTNCVRNGPESQNREVLPVFRAHLEGRVGFVESIHAARGTRLRQLLERVEWE